MKTKNLFQVFLAIVIVSSFSSCIAFEFAELAELGEAAEFMAGEEIGVAEFGGVATEEGLFAVEDVAAFNENLPRLRFMPETTGNPEIGLLENGRLRPVAEVLTEENYLRLNNGEMVPMHKEIYAINTEEVSVRSSASSGGNVVGKLTRENMVIKLYEEKGWYRVRFGEYNEGYVNPAFLLFVGGYVEDKKKRFLLTHPKKITTFLAETPAANNPNSKDVALVVADSLSIDIKLTTIIKLILEARGYRVTTTLFNEDFVKEGYFKLLLDGQVKDFANLSLTKYVDFIFLVSKPVKITGNQFPDMVSAKAPVNIQVLSATSGAVVDSRFNNLAGAGFSDKQANETLNNHIKQKMESYMFTF
ncbi:MAG: SH3 domain-containing protein [Saprospiraceae bacterium]